MENVGRWLPIQVDPTALADSLANKILYPQTVPVTKEDLYLEQAMYIEELRKNPEKWYQNGKITIPPKLSTIAKSKGELMLMVLNALEPQGVVEVENLGIVITPDGNIQKEKQVCEINVDFGLTNKQKVKVSFDEIAIIPIPEKQKTILDIHCFSPFKLDGKDKIKLEVEGGQLGVIIDARGRPLDIPGMDTQGRKRMEKWRKSLNAVWSENG